MHTWHLVLTCILEVLPATGLVFAAHSQRQQGGVHGLLQGEEDTVHLHPVVSSQQNSTIPCQTGRWQNARHTNCQGTQYRHCQGAQCRRCQGQGSWQACRFEATQACPSASARRLGSRTRVGERFASLFCNAHTTSVRRTTSGGDRTGVYLENTDSSQSTAKPSKGGPRLYELQMSNHSFTVEVT